MQNFDSKEPQVATRKNLQAARRLFFSQSQASLSTLSARKSGFPFGSVVNYYFDQEGQPLILISGIAQHSSNIMAKPNLSLLIQPPLATHSDPQSSPRLSIFAKATSDAEEQGLAYFRLFPQGKEWHSLNFRFFQLELFEAQYIGGPGQVAWLKGQDLLPKRICNEIAEEKFLSLISFRTQRAIARLLNAHEEIIPVGVDADGLDFRSINQKLRLHFSKRVNNLEEAREEIMALALG